SKRLCRHTDLKMRRNTPRFVIELGTGGLQRFPDIKSPLLHTLPTSNGCFFFGHAFFGAT
ncbi:hypothetical protein, partial [Agrobacterium fabrum]|uniref:hypothetical protein n=1 Tax=Agrobacterium fabrum TaxID=1176649 RepID=UPI00193E03CA